MAENTNDDWWRDDWEAQKLIDAIRGDDYLAASDSARGAVSAKRASDRLADWIEANCEGVEVVRETGMVIT